MAHRRCGRSPARSRDGACSFWNLNKASNRGLATRPLFHTTTTTLTSLTSTLASSFASLEASAPAADTASVSTRLLIAGAVLVGLGGGSLAVFTANRLFQRRVHRDDVRALPVHYQGDGGSGSTQ